LFFFSIQLFHQYIFKWCPNAAVRPKLVRTKVVLTKVAAPCQSSLSSNFTLSVPVPAHAPSQVETGFGSEWGRGAVKFFSPLLNRLFLSANCNQVCTFPGMHHNFCHAGLKLESILGPWRMGTAAINFLCKQSAHCMCFFTVSPRRYCFRRLRRLERAETWTRGRVFCHILSYHLDTCGFAEDETRSSGLLVFQPTWNTCRRCVSGVPRRSTVDLRTLEGETERVVNVDC
jgi:hypothetical protein